ncbi:MAG: glycosyltransferase family 39 protein [Pirellulales bacterium]|nr:glycosyltransferase family 39 protein [Pirellulales bacterium]
MTANGSESTWRFWAPLALVIAAVMFFAPLGIGFPLLDPDEGLHAGIAREMVERGDWVTPRFLGEPFLDKPILYFWAEAASLKLFGFNEAAVRLPGLMFGLLGAATTGLLAWRLFGASTGWIAGILYATTILPTALAQAATHDVALVPWINLAVLLLWESQRGGKEKTILCIVGAGFFVGLSVLTKGLTGVAVVGLTYGGYRVLTRRIDLALVVQGVVVLTVAALVAAPWYIALEIENPGYLHYYFVERHLLGAATESQPHGNQPWWYYFPLLLGGGLPWIGYLPVLWRKKGTRDQGSETGAKPQAANPSSFPPPCPSTLLWFWLIGWVLFLTLVRSKLVTYLWPAFPPLAILAATVWLRLINGSLGEAARRSFARTFVWSSWSGPLVLPAAVLAIQLLLRVRFPWPVWAVTAIVAAAAPLPLIPWRAGRPRAALGTVALSLAAQFTVIMWLVLPQVADRFSARDLAEHFNREGAFPQHLFVVEERIGSVVFYLDPQIRSGLTPDRLQRLSFEEPPQLAPADAVAFPLWRFDRKASGLDFDFHDEPCETAGRYRLYRITEPRPAVAPE